MEKPLVTIIVPVWNVEPYIRKCLDSLLCQTYSHTEIILVDDGSPDNSGKICNDYAVRDERVHVVHQSNKGVSVARQKGLDAAAGEWVIHVDPDDYVEPDMIETLVAKAVEDKADMVTCNFYINEGQKVTRHYEGHDDLLRKMLQQEIEFSLWNVLVRRSFVKEHHVSFTPSWLCHNEDHLFIIRCLAAGAVPTHLDRAFYHYMVRGNSLVTTRSKKAFSSIKAYISELENLVESQEYDDLFRLKRYAYIYAYESRYFEEMQNLFLDIRRRLFGGGNSDRYSIDSQLSRCMKHPPVLVWMETKIHKYLKKMIGK